MFHISASNPQPQRYFSNQSAASVISARNQQPQRYFGKQSAESGIFQQAIRSLIDISARNSQPQRYFSKQYAASEIFQQAIRSLRDILQPLMSLSTKTRSLLWSFYQEMFLKLTNKGFLGTWTWIGKFSSYQYLPGHQKWREGTLRP